VDAAQRVVVRVDVADPILGPVKHDGRGRRGRTCGERTMDGLLEALTARANVVTGHDDDGVVTRLRVGVRDRALGARLGLRAVAEVPGERHLTDANGVRRKLDLGAYRVGGVHTRGDLHRPARCRQQDREQPEQVGNGTSPHDARALRRRAAKPKTALAKRSGEKPDPTTPPALIAQPGACPLGTSIPTPPEPASPPPLPDPGEPPAPPAAAQPVAAPPVAGGAEERTNGGSAAAPPAPVVAPPLPSGGGGGSGKGRLTSLPE